MNISAMHRLSQTLISMGTAEKRLLQQAVQTSQGYPKEASVSDTLMLQYEAQRGIRMAQQAILGVSFDMKA